jgi:hypothetical protein
MRIGLSNQNSFIDWGDPSFSFRSMHVAEWSSIFIEQSSDRDWRFRGCSSLLRIESPSSIEMIDAVRFHECTWLDEIRSSSNRHYFFELKSVISWNDQAR